MKTLLPPPQTLFIALTLALLPATTKPEPTASLDTARAMYAEGRYQQAANLLQKMIETDPDNSVLHNLLGRSYGRRAEDAVFWKAIKLTKKTGHSFKKAVELDPTNQEAVRDLIKYYEDVPEFIGGSREKADYWREHLEGLGGAGE